MGAKEDLIMLTNDFKGLELSRLGFGTIRLPVRGGNASDIDEKQVDEMVDYAIANGINYMMTFTLSNGVKMPAVSAWTW